MTWAETVVASAALVFFPPVSPLSGAHGESGSGVKVWLL
jgi:hypothetical protein